MTIRTRGSSFQVDVVVAGKRFRRNCPTLAEAQALHDLAEDCLKRGVPVEQDQRGGDIVTTMQELARLTHERHWAGSKNESNVKTNTRLVLDVLGRDTDPRSIGQAEIDKLVSAFRAKGNSPATMNRKLNVLSKMLRFAEERDIIARLPKIERFREEQTRIRWYSAEEEATILNYLRQTSQNEFHDLVVFALDTGCRAAEIGNACWRDITGTQLCIPVSKSARVRYVPLTKRVQEMLAGRSGEPHELIFPGWLSGSGKATKMSKAWVAARRAVGIHDESACFHALRHTFASRLVQAGAPMRAVQQLLGHSSINTTQRYAHLANSNLEAAVAMLEPVTRHRTETGSHRAERHVTQGVTEMSPITRIGAREAEGAGLLNPKKPPTHP